MRLIESLQRRLLLTSTVSYTPAPPPPQLPLTFNWNAVVDSHRMSDADVAERSLLKATQVASTNDLFLRLDGIAGASTDPTHLGEISVYSMEWSGDRSTDFPNAGPFFNELHLVANTTQGSALLVDRLSNGTVVPTADLTARYRTGTRVEFLKVHLSDVLVSSYFVSSGTGTLREEITLKFSRADAQYFPVVGGIAQAPDTFSWDAVSHGGALSDAPIAPPRELIGNVTPFASTQNMYLRIDGIPGESTASGFTNQIIVGGFEWQMDRTATPLNNSITFGQIRVISQSNSVTPKLIDRMVNGQISPTATLTIRQTGATPVEIYKLDLNSVRIANIRTTSVNTTALDEYAINYASFTLTTGVNSINENLITLGATGQTYSPTQRDIGRLTTLTPSNSLFLNLAGVTGNSTDPAHLNEISILSYEWDLERFNSNYRAGELHIAALTSKATPALASRMAQKTVSATGKLTVRSSAALGSVEFLTIDFTNARIGSLRTSTAFGDTLIDEFTLSFAASVVTTRQILAGGVGGTPVSVSLNPPFNGQDPFALSQRTLLAPSIGRNGVDAFLQLNGIAGEAVTINHANEIEISNFEWQMDSVSVAAPVYYELQVTGTLNSASVQLIQRLATNTTISTGKLTVLSQSGFPAFDQYVLNLTNLRVGSYRIRTSTSGIQEEEITLTFQSFNLGFRQASSDPLTTFNSTSAPAGTTPDFAPVQDSLLTQTAPANPNMVLAMSGINGEVNDATYLSSTATRAFQWSLNNTGSGIAIGELQMVSPVSKITTQMLDRLANGTVISSSTLAGRRLIGPTNLLEYFRLTLTNARVSSHAYATANGAMLEEYTLQFNSLAARYVPVTSGGTAGTPITYTFNALPSGTFVDPEPFAPELAHNGLLTPLSGASMFLRLDGISGESADPSFLSNIDLLSFNWSADVFQGARPDLTELRFATRLSKGALPLLQRLVNGLQSPTGTFSVRNNGTALTFFKVDFQKAAVSSYQLLDAGNGGLIEEFTLHVDIVPDTTVPHLLSTNFEFETRQAVNITFDEQVGASIAPSDFEVFNISSGQTLPAAQIAVSYDFQQKRATITFPGVAGGILPDGNYSVRIVAGSITDIYGNALAATPVSTFHVLAGDLNRDKRVDFDDMLRLAQNYGQTGKVFSQGNINYSADGLVGFDDLLILAQRYGTILLTATGPMPTSARKDDVLLAGLLT